MTLHCRRCGCPRSNHTGPDGHTFCRRCGWDVCLRFTPDLPRWWTDLDAWLRNRLSAP